MNNLQITLEERYATKNNLDRIVHLSPDAKITVFRIRGRYSIARMMRGLFRRTLPWSLYKPLAKKLDPLCEAQKIEWIHSPVVSSNVSTILLYPPDIEYHTTKQLLDMLSPCWIHSIPTGIDKIPPIPAGTLLTNSRGIHSSRIAEFTIGLIFAMAKNIPAHTLQTKKRIWKTLPSRTVHGSRLGIVGLGSIGMEIARLGKAAGMEVWATKRKMLDVPFIDRLLTSEELPSLLRESDYVVIALPLTRETQNLIGINELNLMKPTACLINIGRSEVIDENSLYQTLRNNSIRGACIDVFQDNKPLPQNSRFYNLPNLLITSYSAYYSPDSVNQVIDLFFENLRRFVVGEPLLNLVEPSSYSLIN